MNVLSDTTVATDQALITSTLFAKSAQAALEDRKPPRQHLSGMFDGDETTASQVRVRGTLGASFALMQYDLLLLGATGFTGRLVLECLRDHAPATMHIALGARNTEKLASVQRAVGTRYDGIQLDTGNAEEVERAVGRARVVCTTVGPYAIHGRHVAAACARMGVHYCDLTGEVTFMRRSIDENHAAALASGAKIVHACGFDAIPSDLGVWMVADAARKRYHTALGQTRMFVGPMRGGLSGGTLASMLELLREARTDRTTRRLLANPYALSPDPAADLNLDPTEDMRVHDAPEVGNVVVGPFLMAGCNTRVVRRSNALLNFRYGKAFRYSEEQVYGKGLKGKLAGYTFVAGMGALVATQSRRLTASLVQKFLPKSGEGPSPEERAAGFFKIRIVATTEDGAHRLTGRVSAQGDPGYAATAMMLGESALCLADDTLPPGGGVLTPASAMNAALIERLRAAGMTFDLDAVEV